MGLQGREPHLAPFCPVSLYRFLWLSLSRSLSPSRSLPLSLSVTTSLRVCVFLSLSLSSFLSLSKSFLSPSQTYTNTKECCVFFVSTFSLSHYLSACLSLTNTRITTTKSLASLSLWGTYINFTVHPRCTLLLSLDLAVLPSISLFLALAMHHSTTTYSVVMRVVSKVEIPTGSYRQSITPSTQSNLLVPETGILFPSSNSPSFHLHSGGGFQVLLHKPCYEEVHCTCIVQHP